MSGNEGQSPISVTRERDPVTWAALEPLAWTDYDSMVPYGDGEVTVDGQTGDALVTQTRRYLDGSGAHAQHTISTGATRCLHGDLIRSTNLTTDDSGSSVASVAYTAFGEAIGDPDLPDTRYQYAGGWGYETAGFGDDPGLLVLEGAPGTAPITLQHVGFRWYDPSIGRFLQRDPIGLLGGLNVYEYVASNPLAFVDPNGDWLGVVIRIAVRIAIRARWLGPVLGRPAPPLPPRILCPPEQRRSPYPDYIEECLRHRDRA